MKGFKHFIFAALAVITVMSAPAAHAEMKDVVKDARSNVVYNTFGNCVLTKWDAAMNECSDAPAPAEVSPTARSYQIFFDFDSATLTGNSGKVVESIAMKAMDAGQVMLKITGHADRSGSDAYNMALSKRRAVTVKSTLAKHGIKADVMSLYAEGERSPLVQTADGVREPQNRRVEVKVMTK